MLLIFLTPLTICKTHPIILLASIPKDFILLFIIHLDQQVKISIIIG